MLHPDPLFVYFTQRLRSISAETSRSRAIFATGYFSSEERSSRTDSSMNSVE